MNQPTSDEVLVELLGQEVDRLTLTVSMQMDFIKRQHRKIKRLNEESRAKDKP